MKYFSSEAELLNQIRRWTGSPASPFGIGDDAAFLTSSQKSSQVITTDFLIEGVDFKRSDDLRQVGRKALAVNLSDLAAMGARPQKALIYLAFPKKISTDQFRKIFQGWNSLAKKYGVQLIGGDLSRSDKWMIGTVLIGERKLSKHFLRSGAKVGDSLWVTGNLGGSILGKHFQFEPRVKEALFLAKNFPTSSCIDLSDGLAQDLPRLLKASRKGVELDLDRIPISQSAWCIAHNDRRRALQHAFQDGEDFELLFSLPVRWDQKLLMSWKKNFRTPLSKIGIITRVKKIRCRLEGKHQNLPRTFWKGFDHFQ